jgi:hypothetical protein
VARGVPIESGGALGTASTLALAGIDVESPHATLVRAWDIAFDFAFDRQPLLSMTKAAPAPLPRYTAGFATSAAFRIAHALSSSSEIAVVGGAGVARIDDIQHAAANDIGPAAAFFDAKIDVRWFGRDVSLVRQTGQMLMPILQGYVGVRHDQRFHRAGDLSGFDDPTGRVIVGVAVNPIRVAARHADAHGSATLVAIGGGFDLERALRGAVQLPSGFRAMLRADVDVTAAMRGR